MDTIETGDTEINLADFDFHEGMTQTTNEEADSAQTEDEESQLPEKYRGKTIHDIIKMHQNAEQELGRKGQELGDLRKLTDSVLSQSVNGKTDDKKDTSAQEGVDDLEFFENPKEAINKYLKQSPEIQAFREAQREKVAAKAVEALSNAHPDYQEVVNSEEFVTWVKGSKTRMRLMIEADQRYDVDAANELLTAFKATRVRNDLSEQASATRKKAMGDTGRGSMSRDSGSKQKVFSRLDLMRMKIEDPERYSAMQPEILRAYQEGRVK